MVEEGWADLHTLSLGISGLDLRQIFCQGITRLLLFNEECLVSACHQHALITSQNFTLVIPERRRTIISYVTQISVIAIEE